MIRNVLNIPLRQKQEAHATYYCSIGKAVELSRHQYERFKNNLLDDYDFIADNQEVMRTNGLNVKECLLVLCQGQDDGILVYSEGLPYAMQSAYLPYARQLWRLIQYPTLEDLNARMERITDQTVNRAVERNQDGVFRLLMDDVHSMVDNAPFDDTVFLEMLSEHPEFEYVESFGDEIVCQMKPEYANTEDAEYRELTKDEVEVICAKHTLWLHGVGGERADFSGCEIRDMDLRCKSLSQAILDGAKFVTCRFEETDMKEVSAQSATFSDCTFFEMDIEDSDLKGARFYNTQFTSTQIARSNLTDVKLQDCSIAAFDVKECCLQGVDYDKIPPYQIGKGECVENEEWWLDHYCSEPNMTMS